MRPLRSIILVTSFSVFIFAENSPAFAHTPFTTQVQQVVLPEGQVGEIRLLHGDGIVTANPIRVIVVSAEGRLLARSHKSTTMTLVCWREQRCDAYDVGRAQVLEINPSTFREGPQVPYYGDELWAIESGDENWGFSVRSASLMERVQGEFVLAKTLAPLLAILFTMGILVAAAGAMVWRRPSEAEILGPVFS